MHIAIILNCLCGGGAERIAGYLSKYLSEKYDVYLFLEDVENIVYEYGGQIVNVGKDGSEYLEDNIRIAKIKYNIDVSISHMEYFNHINIRTRGRDAVILTEHTCQRSKKPREYVDEIQNISLYPLADHIVTVSDGVRDEIINTIVIEQQDISTIYNFFDCEMTKLMSVSEINWPLEIDSHESDTCKLIISIGRLVEQKDHVRLLKQFEILHKKNKKTKLVIVGSGELEYFLRNIIADLRLKDSVFILPYMENPFPVLKSADVFVFSSRCEGYGNVLLEAMALNVPVVSVDCLAGPREILNDSTDYTEKIIGWKIAKRGILVTDNESERTGETGHLADAIETVLNNEELRNQIVNNAAEWIKNRSNMEILEEWICCIKKAIKKKNENPVNYLITPQKGKSYVIYGTGKYAKKIFDELQKEEICIDAFIVSEKTDEEELFGRPIYQREILLNKEKKYDVIMGVANWEYANQICKWFMDNNMYNLIFYSLSKEKMEA